MVCAELIGNRVVSLQSWDIGVRVLDDLPILDIHAANLSESTASSVVIGEELSDDGEFLGSINGVAGTGTEESGVTHTEGVEITSGVVAYARISALSARAFGLGSDCARMRSESGSVG